MFIVYMNIYYIYRIYISSMKRNEILPFATTWIGPDSIVLNEISQTEKGKYCMVSLICEI